MTTLPKGPTNSILTNVQGILDPIKPGLELVAQDLRQTISLQTIIHLVFGVTAPAEVARLEKLLEDLRKSFSLGLTVTLMIPWLRREFRGFGPWGCSSRGTPRPRARSPGCSIFSETRQPCCAGCRTS
ncbi:hypothetical protein WMF46_28025 [Sorangium sp. So ce117]